MRPLLPISLISFLYLSLAPFCFSEDTQPLKGRVIMVDAGHGTINFTRKIINSGKETRDKVPEHRLNLQMAEKLKATLSDLGATVIMTRTTTNYWRLSYNSVDDNRARAILANFVRAEALISIHCDWHPNRRVHGVTTLYATNQSQKLGQEIHKQMVRRLKARNRRLVKDNFTILDHAEMPAVIVETGFMSHAWESKRLKSKKYQTKVAKAIAKGIQNTLNP